MKQLRFAVLSTIAYAAVFHQALTVEQIHFFLIEQKATRGQIKKIAADLVRQKKIAQHNQHYFLSTYQPRHSSQSLVEQKMQLAHKAAWLLSWIPTIQLIGLSGAVAAGDPQQNDDIDLFIITKSHCLWISRLCAVILLELLGLRRRPSDRHAADKICLNFFLDQDNRTLPSIDQTLYGAHEVVHMQVLWNEGTTYQDFLKSNAWVSGFLPNAYGALLKKTPKFTSPSLLRESVSILLSLCENVARTLQLYYMKNHQKHETVGRGVARFHPSTTGNRIVKRFTTIRQQFT